MVEAQKVEALPTVEDILALSEDSPERAEKTYRMLSRLLAGLESADERHLSVRVLHKLAAALDGKSLPHLIVRAMPVPGLDRPQTKINTAAGFVFGALLGVIVIFLLEWVESGIVRRPEDVERYLNVPVVGTIPGSD